MAGLGLAAVPESASTAGEPIRDLGKPASNVVAYGTACRYERCPEEACPMARRLDEVVVIPNIAAGLELTDGAPSWRHCPAWLTFFFQLGQRVAAAHEEGTKTCAVVIPPVRSFAALFSATGAVVGVATTARAIPDIDTHFSSLASLKPGTPLVVKMGEKIYAARFSGATERSGASYIKIEYKGMIQFLPKQECHRAQVGSGGKRSLPKSVRPSRGGSIRVVEALLGDEAGEFLSVPTVDAVLVGHVTLLTQELESVQIRPEGEPAAAAPLGALLRPSRFLPDGGIPRSLLVSDRVSEFELPVADTPHVAVFDGARAFSRYRSQLGESSWIAILDRCSATFSEGVDVANQEFAVRRGTAAYLGGLEVPAGAELQAFERAR